MFIDQVTIYVKAGNGGDGAVAWRREKFEPSGGPAGGDGGDGGSVIIQADNNISTLLDYRYQRKYQAPHGENGMGKKMFGKKGEDIVLKVPVGTLIKDKATGGVMADLSESGQAFTIAQGGKGGFGNARFATSTRQAPGFAKAGTKGEERAVLLELKLLADVGLVGFPNVGKSTILSQMSAAKPKIANYHFTTLTPNLGVVRVGEGQSFVMADIPGLIEGASAGSGLGHDFLRHIERTRLLVHVLDVSGSEGRDPYEDYQIIRQELETYNPHLVSRKEIIFANKMDIATDDTLLVRLKEKLPKNHVVLSGSAATTQGIEALKYAIWEALQTIPEAIKSFDEVYVEPEPEEPIIVYYDEEEGIYVVEGSYPDLLLRSTYFDDVDSVRYFQKMLVQKKIVEQLEDLGIEQGDIVNFCGYEFEYGYMG